MRDERKTKKELIEELVQTRSRLAELERSPSHRAGIAQLLYDETSFIRGLVDSSLAFFVALDPSGRTILMNRPLLKAIGRPQEDVTGTDYIGIFVLDEDRERVSEAYRTIVVEKRAVAVTNRIVGKNGSALAVEWHGTPVLKSDKDVDFFFCVGTDVTARELAEEGRRESERRYRQLVENAGDVIFLTDVRGVFTMMNPIGSRISGYSEEELIGKHYLDLVDPEYRDTAAKHYRNQFRRRILDSYLDLPIVTKDGRRLWLGQNVQLILKKNRVVGFQSICRNITERKNAEERLKKSEERYRQLYERSKRGEELYRSLLNSSADAVVIYDMDGKTRYVSPSFTCTFGWTMEEVAGKRIPFVPESESEATMKMIERLIQDGTPCSSFETKRYTKDGRALDISISASRYNDHEGRPGGILVHLRDITPRKRSEFEKEKLINDLMAAREALHYEATHDGLSGIWNRSAILDILHKELCRAQREQTPLGVVIGDVDYFKEVNDRYGHLAGDAVLRELARRIASNIRPYDSVGRYGGEEFILVLPNCGRNISRKMADRLRKSFRDRPMETAEGSFNVTMSFGITAYEGKGACDVDTMIREADEALYRAKHLGRNRVEM